MFPVRKSLLITAMFASSGLINSFANAACSSADLKGTWQVYTEVNSPFGIARCNFTVPKTGSTLAKSSTCHFFNPNLNMTGGVTDVPVTGDLTVTKNCNVSGNLVLGPTPNKFDGWINTTKNTISGVGWGVDATPGDTNYMNVFTGVKQ